MPSLMALRIAVIAAAITNVSVAAQVDEADEIFKLPATFNRIRQHIEARQNALRQRKLEDAEQFAQAAVNELDNVPETLLLLAATQAERGKTQPAFETLSKAVDAGMNNLATLDKPVFKSLRELDGWDKLVERAKAGKLDPNTIWRRKAKPSKVEKGIAMVTAANTMWVPPGNILLSSFVVPEEVREKPVTTGTTAVDNLIREWFAEGTASGNFGDLYDNRDRRHSQLPKSKFPQLSRVMYSPAARAENLDYGCQANILFNGVVMGNSSTSLTTKRIWRCQTRLLLTRQASASQLSNQYANNHIYLYPEHRDYDIGHNGKGAEKGYGDVFFANTPYTITSKGSSGSDKPFMMAVVQTLASFRPEVKKKLTESRLIAPTVQMIFRRCNKNVRSDEEYLTGIAHPPVFEKKNLDTIAMVRMAHAIELEHLPPVARIRVLRESAPKGPEIIFNTSGAVSRIHRTEEYSRKMQIDASASKDLNGETLTYHWKVLTGDADRIGIKRLDDLGSKVELEIPWHGRFPIAKGSLMETNRVDIACFVSNGHYFSAPAIISTYFPDNENRIYDDEGKFVSVRMTKNYVDPLVCPPLKKK